MSKAIIDGVLKEIANKEDQPLAMLASERAAANGIAVSAFAPAKRRALAAPSLSRTNDRHNFSKWRAHVSLAASKRGQL